MTKLVTITEPEAQKDDHACSHSCESCTGKDGDGKGPVLYKIKDIYLSEVADGVTFIAYGNRFLGPYEKH